MADRVGIEPRTIRSYIEKGLLPGPEGAGRSAVYGQRHLNRLQIIKVRKDRHGWALEDIRRQLLGMTELEIRELAEALGADEQVWTQRLDELPESPLEYVKAIQALRANEDQPPAPTTPLAGKAASTRSARLTSEEGIRLEAATQTGENRRRLFALADDRDELSSEPMAAFSEPLPSAALRSSGSTKAKLSYEIEVTPDVSLVVRGFSPDDELAELKLRRFEIIAERLCDLLSSPPEDTEELMRRLKKLR